MQKSNEKNKWKLCAGNKKVVLIARDGKMLLLTCVAAIAFHILKYGDKAQF
jgi:hypothetical protein